MSGGNGKRIQTLGDRYNVSVAQATEIAEELSHATYLVCTKEGREREQHIIRAFEERIAGLEARLSALEAPSSS